MPFHYKFLLPLIHPIPWQIIGSSVSSPGRINHESDKLRVWMREWELMITPSGRVGFNLACCCSLTYQGSIFFHFKGSVEVKHALSSRVWKGLSGDSWDCEAWLFFTWSPPKGQERSQGRLLQGSHLVPQPFSNTTLVSYGPVQFGH